MQGYMFKNRIQRIFDSLIFAKKKTCLARATHARNELGFIHWRKFQTKCFEKNRREIGDLIYDHDLTN